MKLIFVYIQVFLLIFGLLPRSAHADDPVNLVVFLSDDLGRLDTSIHGSVDARTPFNWVAKSSVVQFSGLPLQPN